MTKADKLAWASIQSDFLLDEEVCHAWRVIDTDCQMDNDAKFLALQRMLEHYEIKKVYLNPVSVFKGLARS